MAFTRTYGRNRRRGGSTTARLVTVGAMCVGLVVVVATTLHLSSGPSKANTPVVAHPKVIDDGMIDIIVPVQSVPPGTTLDSKMFRHVRKPELIVGADIIRDFEEIKGLYSKGMLVADQPIHRDFLTSLQPVNALTASIPKGYRAIAIAVDATSSVEGWAQPGARVDVIWVTKDFGLQMAYVIAPNAKVLSANKKAEGARVDGQDRSAEVPTTVTLLLSVRDAMRVRLAALNGRLALVLRGIDSDDHKPTGPISEGALFNLANKGLVVKDRNVVDVKVRDRRTGKVETLKFEDGLRVKE
ncbi:MAG: Flp pilus assembly protein CpaB [Pseudomonadota bacterium]